MAELFKSVSGKCTSDGSNVTIVYIGELDADTQQRVTADWKRTFGPETKVIFEREEQ